MAKPRPHLKEKDSKIIINFIRKNLQLMLQEYDWHHLRLRLGVYKAMVRKDHKGMEIN